MTPSFEHTVEQQKIMLVVISPAEEVYADRQIQLLQKNIFFLLVLMRNVLMHMIQAIQKQTPSSEAKENQAWAGKVCFWTNLSYSL